ncbi:hypothetical protein BDW02DRAFT_600411 [Decorospora gaudefroyi]|uniref:Uncharacterized protein n=1 Tax=Decorospora gaudefroyi TaxID=184978 RepID=A0A6A5K3V1_9PLEO|nr:hypothetical protein BDW02DRAFT_600411 [Decorospora gaudefroyi]
MRSVTDGPVICGLRHGLPERDPDSGLDRGADDVRQAEIMDTCDAFVLGPPTSSTLVQKRRPSPPYCMPEMSEKAAKVVSTWAAPPQHGGLSVSDAPTNLPGPQTSQPAMEAPEIQDLRTSADRRFHHEPVTLERPASAPVHAEQPTEPRISHGPTKQPPISRLLKAFPCSIRDRVRTLVNPQPLPYRWKFPSTKRYHIHDQEAFTALKEKNIEWYVTTGLLVENRHGLRWAAGNFDHLLFWHEDDMSPPLPAEDSNTEERNLFRVSSCSGFMTNWQRPGWNLDTWPTVAEENRPATPIVDKTDTTNPPCSSPGLDRVRSLPPTPSSARSLPADLRSAFSRRSSYTAPTCGKKVRLHHKRRRRILEVEVDDEGVVVEKGGKVVETMVDVLDSLSDNEGKTLMRRRGGVGNGYF